MLAASTASSVTIRFLLMKFTVTYLWIVLTCSSPRRLRSIPTNAVIANEDTARLAAAMPGQFDRVLVDAPCSGEGMFRKEAVAAAQHNNALLLNRDLWMNPLSKVMGGWGIWETVNGEQKLTTECIENVIMMMPFSAVVMWSFEEMIGNGWKKILWYSGKIAVIFSVSIETLQLLLRLGTFQLSDIFYNTVGGVLGGVCYCGIMKVRKRL